MRILTLGYRPHIFSFWVIDTVRICKSNRGDGNYGCMSGLMFNGRRTCKSQVPYYSTSNSTNVLLETAVFSNNRCKILETDNFTFNSKNLGYCYY